MNFYLKSGIYILATISLLSCKRDYTCNCIVFDKNGRKETDTLLAKQTKKDAIYECDLREATYRYNLITGESTDTVLNCDLNR